MLYPNPYSMNTIYLFVRKPNSWCWLAVLGFLLLVYPTSAQLLASTDVANRMTEPVTQQQQERELDQVIDALQRQYKASFLYEKKLLRNKKTKVTPDPKQDVETNLQRILKTSGLTYEKIDDDTYVIVKRKPRTSEVGRLNSLPADYGTASTKKASLRTFPWLARATSRAFTDASALDQEITGSVTDAEDGSPLPGVNVVAKGTTIGTITDIEGNYILSVPDETEVLVFSSVGYAPQEVTIAGQSVINLSMSADVTELGEVVVTALGIEKDSKTLGYATTTVDPEELTVNRTPNVMNSLQGKVAGVNISGLGTGPGGTSKIRIRGQSSISGQNNPLIVINGVPIDNTNFGTNPGGNDPNSPGPDGGGLTSDGGDGLSSINPDDIESMTVLKGATAAALYGSRAKDGVIMITTKKGGGDERNRSYLQPQLYQRATPGLH